MFIFFMSQTNNHTNNGQNWYQNLLWEKLMGPRPPNSSGRGDHRNDYGNKSIAKYSCKGKMKDGPISELTINY